MSILYYVNTAKLTSNARICIEFASHSLCETSEKSRKENKSRDNVATADCCTRKLQDFNYEIR